MLLVIELVIQCTLSLHICSGDTTFFAKCALVLFNNVLVGVIRQSKCAFEIMFKAHAPGGSMCHVYFLAYIHLPGAHDLDVAQMHLI